MKHISEALDEALNSITTPRACARFDPHGTGDRMTHQRVTILAGEHAGKTGRIVARQTTQCIAYSGSIPMVSVAIRGGDVVRVIAADVEPETERPREAA